MSTDGPSAPLRGPAVRPISSLTVADVMSPGVVLVHPGDALGDVLAGMVARRHSCAVVARERRPVGILTEWDVARLADMGVGLATPVGEVMTAPVATVPADRGFRAAWAELRRRGIRHLVVVDASGEACGVVSQTDLRRHLGGEIVRRLGGLEAVLDRDIPAFPREALLSAAVAGMRGARSSFVLVVDGRRPVGIVTERDLPRLLLQGETVASRPLAETMASPLFTLPSGCSVSEAVALMGERGVRHVPVVDGAGDLVGVFSQGRLLQHLDLELVEESREDEGRLRSEKSHLEARLAAALEAAGLCTWEIDVPTQTLTVDEATLELTGFPTLRTKYQEWLDRIHPDDLGAVSAQVESVLAGGPYRAEYRFRHADGRWLWLEDRGRVVVRGKGGEPLTVVGTLAEIGTRRLEQVRVEEQRVLLQALLDAIPEAVWLKDPEGTYLKANPGLERLVGAAPGSIVGRTDGDLFDARTAAALGSGDREAVETGRPVTLVEEIPGPDGAPRSVESVKAAVHGAGGRLIGILGVARDVTGARDAVVERERLLTEAKAARDQLAGVLERVSDGFVALDRDWRYTYVNTRGARLLGREAPADLIGRHIWTEYPEGVGQPFHRAYEEAARTQKVVVIEECYEPWGLWFENRIYPSPDGLSIYFSEITERKRAEAATAEREAHASSLLRLARRLATAHTADEIADAAAEEIRAVLGFGRSRLYLAAESGERVVATDAGGESVEAAPERGLASVPLRGDRLAEEIAASASIVQVEDVCKDPRADPDLAARSGFRTLIAVPLTLLDARVGTICTGTSPEEGTRRLTPGEEEYLTGLGREVGAALDRVRIDAERQRVLEELHRNETRFRALYDRSPDGVVVLDPEALVILDCNPSFCAMNGYTREELVGRPIEVLHRPGDPPPTRVPGDGLLDELDASGVVQRELVHVRKDGSVFPVETSVSKTVLDGRRVFLAIDRDVTERKQAEEELARHRDHLEELVASRTVQLQAQREAAEAASRAKSAFLASMSHEIRTPMNSVLGFSQLLLGDAGLSPQQRERLEAIRRSGEHLLALINDVLEMSKIESGRTTVNPGDVELHMLLYDLESMFRVRTDRKGLALRVRRGPGVPAHVVTDEAKLRQILFNLVGNAVKFTEKGSVEVRAEAAPGPGASLRLVFEVEDTGPGIASEELSRLFRHFEQARAGVAAGAGTGLGLAISRGFARLLGGDVTAVSREGEGSVFRVEVSVEPPAAGGRPEQAAAPARISGLPEGLAAPRVLVVDDNPDNRAILTLFLVGAGLEVETAVNGLEAVEKFGTLHPKLLLMDLKMPVMDGYEAIRRIRETDEGRAVPVIVVTASAFEEDREQALRAGGDDFLAKPFHEDELLEKVGRLLGISWTTEGASVVGGGEACLAPPAPTELPTPLRQALREAVLAADADRALALVGEVARLDAALGAALRDLVDRFEYEELLRLLEASG